MTDLKNILKLMAVPGVGPRRILNLMTYFKSVDRIFEADSRELCRIGGIDQRLADSILKTDTNRFVEDQLKSIENSPFKVTSYFDDDYPKKLKNIYDPPILLYRMGNFCEKDVDAIAIVGTRTPSEYGKAVTAKLVQGLVENQLTIISGFARGIDTVAHKTAIRNGGRTIAVLGNGIDRVYPPENREVKNEIIRNGVYCSEFPIGTKPDAVNFPRRNRIISGLSLGVVVIEAGERSGAILTAYYAVDQNREIYAVPGRINDRKSIGTNRLIQKGAKLVADVDDILAEIDNVRKYPINSKQISFEFKLDGDEKIVYEKLSNEPVNIDVLAESLHKSPFDILPVLLNLEIKGCIRQLAGKMFVRV